MPIDEQWIQDQINQLSAERTPTLPTMPQGGRDDGTRPSWTGLLGEVLSGGQSPTYRLRGGERDTAGNRALLNFGINMLMASGPQRYRPDLLTAAATGLQGAQQSEDLSQRQAQQAAGNDFTQRLELAKLGDEQQKSRVERLKALLPLLQLQQSGQGLPSDTAARAPGTGGAQFTGDLEKDRQLVIAQESKGDPKAINYVAREDPSAIARGATASGKYGFVDSTWREGAALAGVDVSKYPTARDAPEKDQDKVFTAIYGKYGSKPWDASRWSKNWVKDPTSGKYQLVETKPGGTAAPAATTTASTGTTAPPAGLSRPGVQVGGPPPAPPGAVPGAPYTGGGFGQAINPEAARDTAVSRTSPTLRGPGAPDPGRVRADVEAIQSGRALAQATPIPASEAMVAGPGAPSPRPAAAVVPGKPEAFGTTIGDYGSGAATAPPAAAPGAATTPAAATTTPTTPPGPAPGSFEEYRQQHAQHLLPSPEDSARWATMTKPDPEQAANIAEQRRLVETALTDARFRYSHNVPGPEKEKAGSDVQAATLKLADLKDKENTLRENARKQGDEASAKWVEARQKELFDAWKEQQTARTAEEQAQKNQARQIELKKIESEQTLKTANAQDIIKPINAKAETAQAMLRNAQTLRLFAGQQGDANALWKTDLGRRATDMLVQWGGSSSWAKEAAARQNWDHMVDGMFNDVHVPGMGAQSDRETAMLRNQWGSSSQRPIDRLTMASIIEKTAEARIQDAADVSRIVDSGGKVSDIHDIRKNRQVFDRPPMKAPDSDEAKQSVYEYNASHQAGEPYVTWAPRKGGGYVLKWARNTGDKDVPMELLPGVEVTR
jgi:hypothetical protein